MSWNNTALNALDIQKLHNEQDVGAVWKVMSKHHSHLCSTDSKGLAAAKLEQSAELVTDDVADEDKTLFISSIQASISSSSCNTCLNHYNYLKVMWSQEHDLGLEAGHKTKNCSLGFDLGLKVYGSDPVLVFLVLPVCSWSCCGTSRFSFELEVSSSQVNSHNDHTILKTYSLNC